MFYLKNVLLICFLNISCGSSQPRDLITIDNEPPKLYINPEFNKYYELFKNNFNVNPYGTSIDFEKLKEPIAGVCYSYDKKKGYIKIDPDFWKYADCATRENLIFHELGHCVGDLDHDDDQFEIEPKVKIHKSIMNSYLIGTYWEYSLYHNYYIKELNDKLKSN